MIPFTISEIDFIIKTLELASKNNINMKSHVYLEGVIDFLNSKKTEIKEEIKDTLNFRTPKVRETKSKYPPCKICGGMMLKSITTKRNGTRILRMYCRKCPYKTMEVLNE